MASPYFQPIGRLFLRCRLLYSKEAGGLGSAVVLREGAFVADSRRLRRLCLVLASLRARSHGSVGSPSEVPAIATEATSPCLPCGIRPANIHHCDGYSRTNSIPTDTSLASRYVYVHEETPTFDLVILPGHLRRHARCAGIPGS